MIFAILNKLLSISGTSYKTLCKNKGKALLHYVVPPPIAPNFYYQVSHSNKLASRLMVNALLQLGFDVDNTFYTSFPPNKRSTEYDIIIGHGSGFADLCENYPRAKKILLLTGSDPQFGNQAQHDRAIAFQARNSIWIPPYSENLVPSHEKNLTAADVALLMGNDFVKSTYSREFHKKIVLIRNVTPFSLTFRKNISSNSFLFMSSVGQIHRGLDLVLESFSETGYSLNICSDYQSEHLFSSFYKSAFEKSNIHGSGFIKTTEDRLSKLANAAAFSILPSCSEGLSSSLVNMITKGLTPIYTPACGLPFDDIGFCLSDPSVAAITKASDAMVGWSESERLNYSAETTERSRIFQPAAFKQHFANTLEAIL